MGESGRVWGKGRGKKKEEREDEKKEEAKNDAVPHFAPHFVVNFGVFRLINARFQLQGWFVSPRRAQPPPPENSFAATFADAEGTTKPAVKPAAKPHTAKANDCDGAAQIIHLCALT